MLFILLSYDTLCMYLAFTIAVNGGWGSWTSWSSCDATCGGGQRTRQRYCDNPVPSGGGSDCAGSSSQQQICNTVNCPGEISENLNRNIANYVVMCCEWL